MKPSSHLIIHRIQLAFHFPFEDVLLLERGGISLSFIKIQFFSCTITSASIPDLRGDFTAELQRKCLSLRRFKRRFYREIAVSVRVFGWILAS
ncbi:hypothetical protein SUGI_0237150 [Cryptomeria japonica]|nr:hypothetical protein SUGI_0237150 [Cryptomeria japonica]